MGSWPGFFSASKGILGVQKLPCVYLLVCPSVHPPEDLFLCAQLKVSSSDTSSVSVCPRPPSFD